MKKFVIRKGKTTKSRMDLKIIQKQFICNKKDHKKQCKILEGHDVQFARIPMRLSCKNEY